MRSYDFGTGENLWEVGGITVNVIPTPVHLDGLVIATSGFRGNALLAIDWWCQGRYHRHGLHRLVPG